MLFEIFKKTLGGTRGSLFYIYKKVFYSYKKHFIGIDFEKMKFFDKKVKNMKK